MNVVLGFLYDLCETDLKAFNAAEVPEQRKIHKP